MTAGKPRIPVGLGTSGAALWRDVVGEYALRVDEVRVLEAACRTADTVAALDAAMEGEPLTVKGSMGQMREHPLLAEVRMQRLTLLRMLSALRLPEPAELERLHAGERSTKARAAARSRWSQHHGSA